MDAARIRDWLLSTESVLPAAELIERVATKLTEEGVRLRRISTAILTLHPELTTRQVIWKRGQGTKIEEHFFDLERAEGYFGSPAQRIREGGKVLRQRLDIGELDIDQLRDLARAGDTDYIGFPLPFSDGQCSLMSFTTDAPGGFSDAEVAALELLLPALRMRLELESAYHARQSLLSVYLGRSAADRVLAGAFRRGTGETIACAIWFCDLRNFTSWVDSTPVREVLAGLNQYFDATAGAVIAQGGEVLKYIGDAVLAIFPTRDSVEASCRSALAAAERALASLEAISSAHPISAGIALHVGEVMFGNIGASSRLDFTVIGPAVNEVTRIEALCKPLGAPLLMSEQFAQAAQVEVAQLGEQQLKGVSAPIRVATLPRFAR